MVLTIMVNNPNDGSAIVTADLSNITVTFDADTAELVFRDNAGSAMGFAYAGSANGLQPRNRPIAGGQYNRQRK